MIVIDDVVLLVNPLLSVTTSVTLHVKGFVAPVVSKSPPGPAVSSGEGPV